MSHKLFTTIGSIVIFSIWIFIGFTAIRLYIRVMRIPGASPFMTKRDISQIKDPALVEAIFSWKRIMKKLFALWIVSGLIYILISIIIEQTIGFTQP